MNKNRVHTNTRVIVTGPDKRLRFGWWATRFMLFLVGLRGVYVTPKTRVLPDDAGGVIIGGGDDIAPEHYGLIGDAVASYDPERDELEMRVVRHALKCRVPILGICRGAQLLNVVSGGSLFMDIRSQRVHTPNRNSIFPIKWADLTKGSALARMIGENPIKINSLHNQAIDAVAPSLTISAKDRDGFIQAVESPSGVFILGLQWHPEYMPFSRAQRRIFKEFSVAVKGSVQVFAQNSLPIN